MYRETCLRQPSVDQLQLAFIKSWLHYRGKLKDVIMGMGDREAGCLREIPAILTKIDRSHCMYHTTKTVSETC